MAYPWNLWQRIVCCFDGHIWEDGIYPSQVCLRCNKPVQKLDDGK
jgi:hypothetical protein